MFAQIKTVAGIVAITVALVYTPAAWRTAQGVYNALVKAEQMYLWLSAPLATVDGEPTNRAKLLDCAVKTALIDARAAEINPAFTKDTGGCK